MNTPVNIDSPLEQDIKLPESVKQEVMDAVGDPKKAQKVIGIISSSFSGPLPPARELRHYNEVMPGAAERIVSMAEREQVHRINWETKALEKEALLSLLGLIFGFLTFVILIISAIICVYMGNTIIAGSLIGATALGLIPAFLNHRGLFNWFKKDKDGETHKK